MFVTGQCKKCGGRTVFDVSTMTKEEVENWMEKHDFGHCSVGWHVEVGKMANYYELDWSKTFATIEEAKEYNNEKSKTEKIAV